MLAFGVEEDLDLSLLVETEEEFFFGGMGAVGGRKRL